MKTHHLSLLRRDVSCLCMGSMIFSPERKELTFELLDAFTTAGGNLIDTAEIYAGGKSEQAIGLWLQERNNREDVLILDKGCADAVITPEKIRRSISVNLERLGTGYLDIWMFHRDDREKPIEMIVDTLNEEVEKGCIRSFGGSNWHVDRIQAANEYAEKHGLMGMIASSPHLSLATAKEPYWGGCVNVSPEEREWHRKHQFPLFSWSSQARGFFSGRFSPDDTSNADMVRVFYSDENFEKLRRAQQLGEKKGATAIQIALAYVLSQPFPTVALIGPANLAELESCVQAQALELTPDEIQWLELKQDDL